MTFPKGKQRNSGYIWQAGCWLIGFLVVVQADAAPSITKTPVDVTVTSGQNATFTVAASGSSTISYQWQRSGFNIPGATSSTWVVGAAKRADAGWYDVIVTDSTGSTTSAPAQLLVRPTAYATLVVGNSPDDPALERSSGFNVYAVLPLPDGSFIAGGEFERVNGVPHHLVVRVKSDGTVDNTFAPDIVGTQVRSIARTADGKFIVAGEFQSVDGYHCHGIARLNPDGSIDPSFSPAMPDLQTVIKVLVRPDGDLIAALWGSSAFVRISSSGQVQGWGTPVIPTTVTDAAEQPDGKIVVVGGSPGFAMRLNMDGTRDSTFNAGAMVGFPNTVALDAAGRIIIGGSLSSVGGTSVSGIVRLLGNGAVDTTFNATLQSNALQGSVTAVALQPDGKVVIGGNFTTVNGASRGNIARLNGDGSADSFAANDPVAYSANALAVLANGSVVAGMSYWSPGSLVRYTSTGSLDSTFAPTIQGVGYPIALAPVADGKFWLLGRFDVGGSPQTTVIRLQRDGTIDPNFPARAIAGTGSDVQTALALPDGRVAVAGSFTQIEGYSRQNLAVLTADGSVDPTFNPRPVSWSFPAQLALSPDGKLVVGASPTISAGALQGIVLKYALDGSMDPTFKPATFDNIVRALLVQRDGRIIVGGNFGTANGQAVRGLVRLNLDGSLDPTFTANLANPYVSSAALTSSGKIIVGIGYDQSGSVVRLNSDGSLDSSFSASVGGAPSAIVVQEDGAILLRARYPISANGRSYLARLNTDGTLDPSFSASGIYESLMLLRCDLLVRDDGQLLVLDRADRFFVTHAGAAPTLTSVPSSQVVTPRAAATLSAVVSSEIPVQYQWTLNGVNLPGATNATLTLSSFGPADVGSYSVTVTNDLGTVSSSPAKVDAPAYTAGRLTNLSVRTMPASGDGTLIMGIVLGGAGTAGQKPLLFRAVGPSLAAYGVTNPLPDPMLQLYDSTDFKIDENDDWNGVFDFQSVGAFPFVGTAPKDAAIYNPYATAGAQTMQVLAKPGQSGIVLAEVYDASPSGSTTVFTPRPINGSARSVVGAGNNVLILGFVISGNTPERVLIRAVGPTLASAPYNVSGTLADPKLQIYDAASSVVAENDNWGDNGNAVAMSSAASAVGAFPLLAGSKDAAVVTTLSPGAYTAVARGVGDTTGVALIEIYEYP